MAGFQALIDGWFSAPADNVPAGGKENRCWSGQGARSFHNDNEAGHPRFSKIPPEGHGWRGGPCPEDHKGLRVFGEAEQNLPLRGETSYHASNSSRIHIRF